MGKRGIISFQNVAKKFGKRSVINNLRLDIDGGEFLGIVGLSGSGKTTLLNMLIGVLKPSAGKIFFDGKEIWGNQNYVSNFFGFSTQGGSTYDSLTVKENLRYFGKLYNMSKSDITARSEELLKMVELKDSGNVLASKLSTGMQRRLDIACSLMHNPQVLILDEPTKDLDPFLRKEILAMLKRINLNGATIVMTSHLLDEIESVSDKLAILHNSRIVCCDTPINLKNAYSKYDEMQLRTHPGDYEVLANGLRDLKMNKVVVKSGGIVAYTDKAEAVLPKVWNLTKKKKEHILELKLSKPSIEEIFEAVTKK